MQVSEKSFRRLVRLMAGLAVLMAVACIALNVWADPFAVWRRYKSPTEITFAPELGQAADPRLFRPVWYGAGNFDGLLVGSSRVREGFSGSDFAADKAKATTVFNAAFDGAGLYENARHLEDLIAVRAPKVVYLALDFWQFDANRRPVSSFSEQRLRIDRSGRKNWLRPLVSLQETAFSLSVLQRSFRRIVAVPSRDPCATSVFSPDGYQLRGVYGCLLTSGLASEEALFMRTLASFESQFAGFRYGSPREDLAHPLRRIITAASRAGSRLVVFTTPVHALHLELVRRSGLADRHRQWLEDVAIVLGESAAGSRELWSFTGSHAIAMEAVPREPGQRMTHYFESSHFTPKVGALIARCISGGACDPAFGRRVSASNASAIGAQAIAETPEVLQFVSTHQHLLPRRAAVSVGREGRAATGGGGQ